MMQSAMLSQAPAQERMLRLRRVGGRQTRQLVVPGKTQWHLRQSLCEPRSLMPPALGLLAPHPLVHHRRMKPQAAGHHSRLPRRI